MQVLWSLKLGEERTKIIHEVLVNASSKNSSLGFSVSNSVRLYLSCTDGLLPWNTW